MCRVYTTAETVYTYTVMGGAREKLKTAHAQYDTLVLCIIIMIIQYYSWLKLCINWFRGCHSVIYRTGQSPFVTDDGPTGPGYIPLCHNCH